MLDGFDLAESEDFERWLASRRDDFAHRFGAAARAHAREREAAGDLANALQLHARLIELDPLQESHYAAAMRLHYLAGDRGRAIDVFERCRAILQSELGLEPLPETAALAEHIRAAERVAPLAGAATTAGLAQLTPPLIGRAAELAQLARGPVVTLICGEPGVGKTRLADEYTRGLSGRLRMASSELGRAAPLSRWSRRCIVHSKTARSAQLCWSSSRNNGANCCDSYLRSIRPCRRPPTMRRRPRCERD